MHWVFLTLAVVGEVLGTSLMKMLSNDGYIVIGTVVAMLAVGVSYLLLSQATLRISVTFANAVWEGLGMILIMVVSFVWLQEQISVFQLLGVGLALVGIGVVHYGYHQAEPALQEEA